MNSVRGERTPQTHGDRNQVHLRERSRCNRVFDRRLEGGLVHARPESLGLASDGAPPLCDDKLVLALLQQPTLDKAAAAAGISPATAWRRTQDPDFQDQLRKARRDAFSQSVGRLQQAGPAAVSTLLRVMADPAAAAASRVRAASQVLEISVRVMELDDLEAQRTNF